MSWLNVIWISSNLYLLNNVNNNPNLLLSITRRQRSLIDSSLIVLQSALNECQDGVRADILASILNEFTSIMKGDEISKWLYPYPNSMDKATLNELSAMYSVRKFPVRIKCVLLSWSALLQIAIEA